MLSFDFVLPKGVKLKIGASLLLNGICSTVTKIEDPLVSKTRHSPLAGGEDEERKVLKRLSSPRQADISSPRRAGGEGENRSTFSVDYMLETRKKTTVDAWRTGDTAHFETSLRMGDTIDGHFVFGHIDTVARVRSIRVKRRKTQDARNVDKDPTLPPLQKGDRGGLLQGADIIFSISQKWMKYFVPKGSVAIDGVSLTVVDVGTDTFSVSLIPHTLAHTHLRNLKKGDTVNVECDMLAKYSQRMFGARGKTGKT